jgi:hypothetical protein
LPRKLFFVAPTASSCSAQGQQVRTLSRDELLFVTTGRGPVDPGQFIFVVEQVQNPATGDGGKLVGDSKIEFAFELDRADEVFAESRLDPFDDARVN